MVIEIIFLAVLTLAQVVVLCRVIYLLCCYIKLKHTLNIFVQKLTAHFAMDCDDLLESLLAEPTDAPRGTVQCSAGWEAAPILQIPSASPERSTASVNHK